MTLDNPERRGYGFVLGLLCGAAAGAAVALLVTPTNGRQLRGKLGESARWLGNQSRGAYSSARQTINEAVSAGREAFQKSRTEGTRPKVTT